MKNVDVIKKRKHDNVSSTYDLGVKEHRLKLLTSVKIWGQISGIVSEHNHGVWYQRWVDIVRMINATSEERSNADTLVNALCEKHCEGDTVKALHYIRDELNVLDRLKHYYETYYKARSIDSFVTNDKDNLLRIIAYESMIAIRLSMFGPLSEAQKEKLKELGTDWAEADKDPRVKNLTLSEESNYFPIGEHMAEMKKALNKGEKYMGHDATWWAEHLKGVLSDEFLVEVTGIDVDPK